MNIVLDFDGTICATERQTRQFLNWYFDIQIPLDQGYLCGHTLHSLVQEYLPKGYVLNEDDLYEILGSEFLASMHWHEDVMPIEGATDVVSKLAQEYTLHVATARQTSSRPVVETLLQRFFPNCISDIHFVWEHLGNKEFRGVPKKEFVRKLQKPTLAYVDDNPKETREIIGLAPNVILFDPSGHHVGVTDASHRVATWKEIEKLLL